VKVSILFGSSLRLGTSALGVSTRTVVDLLHIRLLECLLATLHESCSHGKRSWPHSNIQTTCTSLYPRRPVQQGDTTVGGAWLTGQLRCAKSLM
jgi:hypothetical protein